MSLDFFELIGVADRLQSIIFEVTNVIDGIQGSVRLSTSPTPHYPAALINFRATRASIRCMHHSVTPQTT